MNYGLIGEKLGHSFSKTIHNRLGNADYELFEVLRGKVGDFFQKAEFQGVNVTIPYKEIALTYVKPSETAKAIGCVNTVVNRNGELYGYNTDTLGFSYMLKRSGIELADKHIVILGSGGTSKTACYTAFSLGAKTVTVVSRSAKKYDINVSGSVSFITYEELAEHRNADILINTTPVGMYPDNEGIPAELSEFTALSGVVDVVYNPLTTRLVNEAKKRGIQATNGLSMLVAQAWYANRLFFGKNTDMSEADQAELECLISEVYTEKSNFVLIGMPGSGKSTVGAMLAKRYNRAFVDTDSLFQEKNGIGPGEYIEQYGEEAFRDKEAEAVREAASQSGIVIATGGGAVLRRENVDALKSNGKLIYLHRELNDLAIEGRPLSQNDEKRKALYYKRLPIYLRIKDLTVPVSDYENKTVTRVMKAIQGELDGVSQPKCYLILNGPNLNMLGIREPEIYGSQSYADLISYVEREAETLGVQVDFFQSNYEGELVDAIQGAYGRYDGIVINPGAYTHTSVALLDAVKAVHIPTVEVHISEVDKRDEFRQISYIRQAAAAVISGKGFAGYVEGLRILAKR